MMDTRYPVTSNSASRIQKTSVEEERVVITLATVPNALTRTVKPAHTSGPSATVVRMATPLTVMVSVFLFCCNWPTCEHDKSTC